MNSPAWPDLFFLLIFEEKYLFHFMFAIRNLSMFVSV
jgi:hypothetical protein